VVAPEEIELPTNRMPPAAKEHVLAVEADKYTGESFVVRATAYVRTLPEIEERLKVIAPLTPSPPAAAPQSQPPAEADETVPPATVTVTVSPVRYASLPTLISRFGSPTV